MKAKCNAIKMKTRNNTADIVMNFILYLVGNCNVKKQERTFYGKETILNHIIK